MTVDAFPDMMAGAGGDDDAFDAMDPANNSPIVAWLASADAADVTGRVIEIEGGRICLEEGWRHGPHQDAGQRWASSDVGSAIRALIGEAAEPERVYGT